ncbi:MAG: hypothetical protein JRI97_12310 [Deltaproteobacteria bacterium]|nr:hypothetical protein [Deltaproteobacteria bacterium]
MVPVQASALHDFVAPLVDLPAKFQIEAEQEIDYVALVNNSATKYYGLDPRDPAGDFLERRPEVALVVDSYFYNFCKYENRPVYKKQCRFFHDLLNGELGYRLVYREDYTNPVRHLFPDKELSPTFYLLVREGEHRNQGRSSRRISENSTPTRSPARMPASR